ncbi:MAG TPA: hypothetical protein VMU36_05730 [Spirochaetia bacterium]|nr:hypothetical protein [Spirochaetia bacterium]
MDRVSDAVQNSTGPWRGIGFWDHATTCAAGPRELAVSSADKAVLRKLATRVAELAARPGERGKAELWYRHNALEGTRPLILADPENGWNEIITESEVECRGTLARRWEVVLRKELFWAEAIRDDRPVEDCFWIGYTFDDDGWGVTRTIKGGREGGAYAWDPVVRDERDLESLHFPHIVVDHESSGRAIAVAEEVFSGLLKVRRRAVWWWGMGMTFDLARLLGLEGLLVLLYDNPNLIRKAMQFLMDGNRRRLEELEAGGLLSPNNDSSYVGSGGIGYSRELRTGLSDDQTVRVCDLWGHSESQETGSISPEMFEEFIFPYQLEIIKRFGLACYGCCEALERRWHIVRRIPNLRRVSVSAWSDTGRMAENLGDRYICSLKPNPARLAVSVIDRDLLKSDMITSLRQTRGCKVEVIMKDNHTLGGNPENIVSWVQLTREAIEKVYG